MLGQRHRVSVRAAQLVALRVVDCAGWPRAAGRVGLTRCSEALCGPSHAKDRDTLLQRYAWQAAPWTRPPACGVLTTDAQRHTVCCGDSSGPHALT